jgi:hypothetical protein
LEAKREDCLLRICVDVKNAMEVETPRKDSHGRVMHLRVILRRDTAMLCEHVLVSPVSQMKEPCKDWNQYWHWPTIDHCEINE